MVELAGQFRQYFLILHVLGVVIGFGAAIVADTLFFRFLKDMRISRFEANVLKNVSYSVWFGLFLAIVSGGLLFMAHPAALLASDKFIAKLLILLVVIINGLILHFRIHPTLTRIYFGKRHTPQKAELAGGTRMAFLCGAISVTSWFSVFLLGMLPRSFSASLAAILTVYLATLGAAALSALGVQRYLKTR